MKCKLKNTGKLSESYSRYLHLKLSLITQFSVTLNSYFENLPGKDNGKVNVITQHNFVTH